MRELSLHVMDVVQNSISAEASRIEIHIEEDTARHTLEITVTDNGRGMSPEQVQRVQSPFYTTRTTRPVGLGVPLFKMACEMTGGSFSIESVQGEGTVVRAVFLADHIDMIPLGDMNQTIHLLVTCNPDIDFVYRRLVDGRGFTLDTRELREVLGGDISLSDGAVSAWIGEYLAEGQAELEG